MSKGARNTTSHICPQMEIDIEIRVEVRELHIRTGTVCDERSEILKFTIYEEFANVIKWLDSDDAHDRFFEICTCAPIAFVEETRGAK